MDVRGFNLHVRFTLKTPRDPVTAQFRLGSQIGPKLRPAPPTTRLFMSVLESDVSVRQDRSCCLFAGPASVQPPSGQKAKGT